MQKSRLFTMIEKICRNEAGATDDEPLSVDLVIAATLNRIADYAPEEGTDGEPSEELLRTKELLDKYVSDYDAAAKELRALMADSDGSWEKYIYEKIVNELDVISEISDNAKPVTLDFFVASILDEPSDAIREVILREYGHKPTDDENDDEIDEETIEAAVAEAIADAEAESEEEDEDESEEATDDEDEKQPDVDEETRAFLAMMEEKRKKALLDFESGGDETEESDVKEGDESKSSLATIAANARRVHALLSETVYGQDVAISTFVSGYFQAELTAITDSDRVRPRATYLFAGPPGVGKTFLSEQAAAALELPYMRFDMSEYSDKEANIEFCGSDKVYKSAKEGNVTGFVEKNPRCVLLFDEIEKAHLNVIHLFLQILDAGRLRDNYTDREVSFRDAIIIFTTNAGRRMYEDESINLATVSRKSVLKSLSSDINPVTGAPMFPPAICSRFAYGNVIMFNRMSAGHLLKIADRELKKQIDGIAQGTGIKIYGDPLLPYAIIYAEGASADARTVKGRSGSFVYRELYELFRLMQSAKNACDISAVKRIDFKVALPDDKKITSLFRESGKPSVLVFASRKKGGLCKKKAACANLFVADNAEAAEAILDAQDVTAVIVDVTCKPKDAKRKVLNIEDVQSEGRDFLYYIVERSRLPVYVLEENEGDVSDEEFVSLASVGAKGVIAIEGSRDFGEALREICTTAYQEKNLVGLAKANKVLTSKTLQRVSRDGKQVTIELFDFKLATALDADDSAGVIDGVSKPKLTFKDVIGAGDAKDELKYFIEYLKNPEKFMRRGVRAPKGILLYGPPGTGKTLLAKAMAGESDVTFISAEGNQFLKKYVGEGPESVHALFAAARKYAPSVLFIDEIDAVAKSREGAGSVNTGDVLTSFLTEMDGFVSDRERPVFVLAATNYDISQGSARSLDAALLRRFDRKIFVYLPNKEERKEFLNLKLSKVKGHAVTAEQIENISARSAGASLADLDSVVEMALRNVIKTDDCVLSDGLLEDAFETFNGGSAKKWSLSELERTARHEAGHALMCYLGGETPSYLTIVARGNHGGYMQHADSEDKGTYTKAELLKRVRTALGGRGAEVVYYGDEDGLSTGASGDLRTATSIVEQMICSYGMDEEAGLGSVDLDKIGASAEYARIRDSVRRSLDTEFKRVREDIERNRAAIDALVKALLEKNSLKTEEIEEILKDNTVK